MSGRGSNRAKQLRKVWSAEKSATTILGKVYVDGKVKDVD
jgi:hypothetical protein